MGDELREFATVDVDGGAGGLARPASSATWRRDPGDAEDLRAPGARRSRSSTRESGTGGNYLFYLAVPPSLFDDCIEQPRRSRGSRRKRKGRWRRVIIEKPFGHDLESARALNRQIREVLDGAADLPHRSLPRQGDGAEHPGLPLRQRHLRADLEPPLRRSRADHGRRDGRRRRARRLLRRGRRAARHGAEPHVPAPRASRRWSRRSRSRRRRARRAGEGALRRSGRFRTRTCCATRCAASTARDRSTRQTVPALPRGRPTWRRTRRPRPSSRSSCSSTTGAGPTCRSICAPASACRKRVTEIAIQFKRAPFLLFRDTPVERLNANVLVLHIQPDEGISLHFEGKVPGPVVRLGTVKMDFEYDDYFGAHAQHRLRDACSTTA